MGLLLKLVGLEVHAQWIVEPTASCHWPPDARENHVATVRRYLVALDRLASAA